MLQTYPPSSARPAPAFSRWRGVGATLAEVFAATGAEAAAAGFVMAQIGKKAGGPVLWLQDRLAQREAGRPYLPDLGTNGPLLLMQLSRSVDVMIAAEEGLRCKALAAVVAEIRGNTPAVNFTAMKRLALRAEATGVPCWLIRQGGTADLSAARDRWRIASLPSAAHPDDPRAPGDPRWHVELFRSRDRQPGAWVVQHERATNRLDLVAAVPDGPLDAADRTAGQRSSG